MLELDTRHFRALQCQTVGPIETRATLDDVHITVFQQSANTTGEAGHHGVGPLAQLLGIEFHTAHIEAEFFTVPRGIGDFHHVDQGLGGDASFAQANAAQFFLALDEGDIETQVRRAECGNVSAGARADDNEVGFLLELSHDHVAPPYRLIRIGSSNWAITSFTKRAALAPSVIR